MEKREFPFAHPDTRRFLDAASTSGIEDKVRRMATLDPRLRRALEARDDYYNLDINFKEVGERMRPPASHETARKEVRRSMALIWQESSPEIQRAFPFDKLDITKPFNASTRPRRLNVSTRAIADASASGQTYEQVAQTTGVETVKVTNRRRVIKNILGIDVPYKHLSPEEYAELIELCSNPELPREKYEAIQYKITLQVAQHMAHTRRGVMSLTEGVKRCGYLIKTRGLIPVKDVLDYSGLVIIRDRMVRSHGIMIPQLFYFVVERDLDSIASEMADHPEFDRYRI